MNSYKQTIMPSKGETFEIYTVSYYTHDTSAHERPELTTEYFDRKSDAEERYKELKKDLNYIDVVFDSIFVPRTRRMLIEYLNKHFST